MTTLIPVDGVPCLWRIKDSTTGYLIVREGKSLLIDCPTGDLSQVFSGDLARAITPPRYDEKRPSLECAALV